MATLMQTLTQLKAQRSRTQSELKRLNEAIAALEKLVATRPTPGVRKRRRRARRKLSPATRRKISRAQKARWAGVKGKTGFAAERARLVRQRKGAEVT